MPSGREFSVAERTASCVEALLSDHDFWTMGTQWQTKVAQIVDIAHVSVVRALPLGVPLQPPAVFTYPDPLSP